MKYDLGDIQVEIRAVSALASGLGSQCEEGGNTLTSETLTLAILGISSHLDRVAENLEQIESDYYAQQKNNKEVKEDDNQESLGEIKKIIEQTRKLVPEEFDLPGLDLVNAKEISRDVLEGVANGFYLGFYQGKRCAASRCGNILELYEHASDDNKELIERFARKLAE